MMLNFFRQLYRGLVPLRYRLKLRQYREAVRLHFTQASKEGTILNGGTAQSPSSVSNYYHEHSGYCPICERPTKFTSNHPWFRDHLRCKHCGSIPRERGLMLVLQDLYPDWQELKLHESSPGLAISHKFAQEAKHYLATHYYPDITPGTIYQGFRCENLEAQTFPDESFDLVITLDVFEHIFDYRKAFTEVMRTIRPGGAHIFTTPKYKELRKTQDRAVIKDNEVVYLAEPEYHGNPIDPQGSLVTVHYGDDICDIIWNVTEFPTSIYITREDKSGTQAEFMDVFVTKKL